MEVNETQRRSVRRSGPRSRKGTSDTTVALGLLLISTASLTCRQRHTRCDEGRPVCSNCVKARLHYQQPQFVPSKWSVSSFATLELGQAAGSGPNCSSEGIVSEPHSQLPQNGLGLPSVSARDGLELDSILLQLKGNILNFQPPGYGGPSAPDPAFAVEAQSAYLLRVYERGIGPWMDVFDPNLTYQRELLDLVPSSPLLLNAICALAARQLSLIGPSLVWKPIAERYYGQGVHLLARLLNKNHEMMELAIVATMLLGSYELMAFPGLDYQRHFRGATTIVDALQAYKSSSRLVRASFWIYARHEVGEALNRNSPTRHDPRLWPRFDTSQVEPREDSYCNDVSRICAETECLLFGHKASTRSRKITNGYVALQRELDLWFERCPERWKGCEYDAHGKTRYWFPRPNFAAGLDQMDYHSRQIILICLSDLGDAALVVAAHPLCHAAKHVTSNELRDDAVALLDDVQRRTGFHTKSRIER
ncbi:hypothetical protein BDV11DRAFT_170594 [Aspergillus similis]